MEFSKLATLFFFTLIVTNSEKTALAEPELFDPLVKTTKVTIEAPVARPVPAELAHLPRHQDSAVQEMVSEDFFVPTDVSDHFKSNQRELLAANSLSYKIGRLFQQFCHTKLESTLAEKVIELENHRRLNCDLQALDSKGLEECKSNSSLVFDKITKLARIIERFETSPSQGCYFYFNKEKREEINQLYNEYISQVGQPDIKFHPILGSTGLISASGRNTADIPAIVIEDKTKASILIAIHGSLSDHDWLTNLHHKSSLISPDEDSINLEFQSGLQTSLKVHKGFNAKENSYGINLEKKLSKVLDRMSVHDRDKVLIYVTGHSKGGALALLSAVRLVKFFEKHSHLLGYNENTAFNNNVLNRIQVYRLSAPKVFKKESAEAVDQLIGRHNILRQDTGIDMVPTLPPDRLGFTHNGYLALQPPFYAETIQSAATGTFGAVFNHVRSRLQSVAFGVKNAPAVLQNARQHYQNGGIISATLSFANDGINQTGSMKNFYDCVRTTGATLATGSTALGAATLLLYPPNATVDVAAYMKNLGLSGHFCKSGVGFDFTLVETRFNEMLKAGNRDRIILPSSEMPE